MKKLICALLLFGILAPGFAQNEKQQTALESMVATELAFAKMAKDVGTRPAFSAFIADDGILFRPGPVKGKEWLAKNPAPASDKHPWLSWYPAIADISDAGDMGYTTGPWEFRPDINDAKAVAFGNFLTVWKKQADGSWKFAIDLGISGPQPSETIAAWRPPRKDVQFVNGFGPAKTETDKKDITELMKREREFARDSASRGARVAFEDRADRDVRFFREGQQPMGKADAGSFLIGAMNNWTWEPTFADVSRSGDLGYTYGTYRIAGKDAPAKNIESGNYYRIWKKQYGKWLVVADLTNPVPEEKKN